MLLGVDYYPEQWAPSCMEADMDRIVELGCNVIRIGEFAWHRMEPQEGAYDFSFFDGVIDLAKKKGLQIIFGTPTATPPAWLIDKYPDVLSQFEDGAPRVFGGRHTYCFSSAVYREYCKKSSQSWRGTIETKRPLSPGRSTTNWDMRAVICAGAPAAGMPSSNTWTANSAETSIFSKRDLWYRFLESGVQPV